MKEIRVHLELSVPVWHSGLTVKLSADIERAQRVAVGIVLGLCHIRAQTLVNTEERAL